MNHKLILGTVQLGLNYGINNTSGKPNAQSAQMLLKKAYQLGICELDTANAYGNAEAIIGNYHAANPHSVFNVYSKFSDTSDLQTTTEKTLQLLQVNQLACFSFHNFELYQLAKPKVFNTLLQLKHEKKINAVGVSVYTNTQLQTVVADERIDCVQLAFNALDNNSEKRELLQEAYLKGKQIHTRSVFLQGLFFKPLVNYWPTVLLPLKKPIAQLQNLAKEYKLSISELVLNYALAQPFISKVLIGLENETQLNENSAAIKALHQEVYKKIEAIEVTNTELLNPVNWKS